MAQRGVDLWAVRTPGAPYFGQACQRSKAFRTRELGHCHFQIRPLGVELGQYRPTRGNGSWPWTNRERRGVRYTEVRLGWLWRHEPGTDVKFTPAGAEMFAKADGNLKSLVMQSRRARKQYEELRTVLDFLRSGDVLMVTRIDRLARSIGDLQDIVRAVKAKGATLKATEQPIDTSTAAGKCFLDMLGVFAEFETNLRRERQLEGIADAKARGVYRGRKASIDPGKVKALKAEGMGPSAIAKALKIGRASVYRALEN